MRRHREDFVDQTQYVREQSRQHHERKASRRRRRAKARSLVRSETPRLQVTVVGAFNVPKMDFFGKADPYVTLQLPGAGSLTKTSTRYQTFTPIFDESFFFDVTTDVVEDLHLEIFDYDMIGSNELIGTIDIPLIVASKRLHLKPFMCDASSCPHLPVASCRCSL